jgi:hypothetical protein
MPSAHVWWHPFGHTQYPTHNAQPQTPGLRFCGGVHLNSPLACRIARGLLIKQADKGPRREEEGGGRDRERKIQRNGGRERERGP